MFSPSTITTEISICFYVLGRAASRMLVQSLDDAISESARNQAAEIASHNRYLRLAGPEGLSLVLCVQSTSLLTCSSSCLLAIVVMSSLTLAVVLLTYFLSF